MHCERPLLPLSARVRVQRRLMPDSSLQITREREPYLFCPFETSTSTPTKRHACSPRRFQHVRRLGEQGDILIPFRGLVDRGSIEQYLAERRSSRGRGWDEHTAWPAVALLSGLNVDWLGQVPTSRLRARLRHLATYPKGARDLVGRTRTRATIHTYGAYDFITGRLKKEILVVGRRDLGLTEATGASLGGYVVADDLTRLVKRYALESDTRGKLVLRTTSFDIASIKRIVSKGNGALAAFDAAASTDPREHGVGDRFL